MRLVEKLEDATALGSSGLEIIGAIRGIFENESDAVLAMIEKQEFDDAIQFVNQSYGDR
jgi:hypothetical protein